MCYSEELDSELAASGASGHDRAERGRSRPESGRRMSRECGRTWFVIHAAKVLGWFCKDPGWIFPPRSNVDMRSSDPEYLFWLSLKWRSDVRARIFQA